jgi:hypothetical protein
MRTIAFRPDGRDLMHFVESCYVAGGGGFPYSLQPGNPPTLFGTCFAALVSHLVGAASGLRDRSRATDAIGSIPWDERGLLRNLDTRASDLMSPAIHSEEYLALQTTMFARAALRALGQPPSQPVPWIVDLVEGTGVRRWLDGQAWENPWLASNMDMFLGVFLLEWRQLDAANALAETSVHDYFDWHNAAQNHETGFWGAQTDPLNAMAGAYHIVLHYDYAGEPLRRIESMIDAVLRLPWRDGLFVHGGGGGSCEDLDAVDLLVRLSLASNHREQEVRCTLLRTARRIAGGVNADGGYGWRIVPRAWRGLSAFANGEFQLTADIGASWLYALRTRSQIRSTHYYSSCRAYPYRIDRSDMWSTWFRPQTLLLIARRYPEAFRHVPGWTLPHWPGLGFDPWAAPARSGQTAAVRP